MACRDIPFAGGRKAGVDIGAALRDPAEFERRAERLAVTDQVEGSLVSTYLNRLSDLLWAMARWQEGPEHHTLSKEIRG